MKLLLTGAFNYTEEQLDNIKSLGYEIVFVQDERKKLEFDVSDIEAVVCNGLFLYNDIKDFKSLKLIQLTSAGLDRVPVDYINDNGIILKNAKGVYSAPMAEFAISGVLQLYKQSRFFYNNQKNHIWEKHRGLLELTDKCILIFGAGSVGCEIAKRFKAFDANVYGIDICSTSNEYFDKIYSFESYKDILAKADIVVLSIPLTKETEYFFDKNIFNDLKSSAILVNLARGKLINQQDLENALNNGKICGAVLDVFDEEPLPKDSNLWNMENVIITPHNSFVGEYNNNRMFEVIINNLRIHI